MAEKIDRRKLKTDKALRGALAELLTQKELRKVTVQEIADIADVNRVTFYKHYLDVYDLYDKIEADTLVELGLLTLRLEESPAEEFYTNLTGYIKENNVIFKMIFSPNTTGQLRSKLTKLIEGVFTQLGSEMHKMEINSKSLAYLSCYRAQGCLAVISKWVLGGFEEPQDFIVRSLIALDESTEKLFDSNWEKTPKNNKRK